jgi:putative PEP-CTERM system integral membrane protein
MKTILHLTYSGIFWLWNLTFLLVLYAGILPYVAVPLAQATFAGEIEQEFLISPIGMIGTPTVCTLIGWLKFHKRPLELMRLFYGVEAPLFLLCIVRLFVLRELTPASHLIVGTAIACVLAFGVELLWGYLGWQQENDSYIPSNSRPTRTPRETLTIKFLAWVLVRTLVTFSCSFIVLSTLFFGAFVESLMRSEGRTPEGGYFWEKPYFALTLFGMTCGLTLLVELLRAVVSWYHSKRLTTQRNKPLLQLPSPVRRKAQRILPWVQVAAHSLMLFVGLYVGVLLLFYAVPVAAWLLKEFFSFRWLEGFWWELTHYFWSALWYIPIFTILFAGSATLFLGMPSALAALYVHSGQRILRAFSVQYGKVRTAQVALGVVTAWTVLFLAFQNQPQVQAFKLLENPPQTDAQRQELLAKSDEIRTGLLNAYLSPYRYLGSWKESNQIRIMYRSTFGLSEPAVQFLQDTYNTLVSPFLYQGDRKDDQKASKLYEQFFDTPIQKGDSKAVLHALKSTAIIDDAKAGVLNINQEKVWLKKQAVTVKEQGDWADVEIYEVYNNQTFDVEEIFYSFSLPESAVLTGVWLGDTADLNKRFPFKVSPRGAAQKVYNSQVRRERPVDPALLEQVGPRQYRLRAFPVPAKVETWERREGNIDRPTEMHLWLTYKVMRNEKGWELPHLGEKRNIFWTKKSDRLRNGKAVKGFDENWLEASLPASKQQPMQHQVNLDGYQITAKPLTQKDYVLPQNQRFAVILDTSRSMGSQTQALAKTFDWLNKHGFSDNNFTNNDADLYLTAPAGTQPKRLDDLRQFNPRQATFYGSLQLKEILNQFAQLRGDTAYDGIVLVTDEGSYELSKDKGAVSKMPAPLWVVHLGSLAPAYDDGTLKAIQDSGGGVSTDLPEVLQRIATTQALSRSPQPALTREAIEDSNVSVVDGYAWLVEKVEGENAGDELQAVNSQPTTPNVQLVSFNAQQPATENGFKPLAARVLVRALSQETDGKQVEQLDAIHAIAKTHKIVTPYSSMIVLVNDEQRRMLAEAEASSDRFERKVENGKEQLNKPNNPLNAASVPEPGVVVGLGAIALFFAATRKGGRRR